MCLSLKQLKESSTKHNIGRFSISMMGEQEIQLESVPGHSSTGRFPPPKSKKNLPVMKFTQTDLDELYNHVQTRIRVAQTFEGFTKFFISKNLILQWPFSVCSGSRHSDFDVTDMLYMCWFHEVVMAGPQVDCGGLCLFNCSTSKYIGNLTLQGIN